MINFRYHIVSITAVFLALAIGTALGSTFLDGPTVDLLNRNIRNAEDRIEATNLENNRLADLNDAAREREESLLDHASERLVSSLLTDQPILVLVAPGVDTDVAAGVTQMIGSSGADYRGTVAMLEPMLFTGELDDDLAAALDVEVTDQAQLGDEVHDLLLEAMDAAGQIPPVSDSGPDDSAEDTDPDDEEADQQADDQAPADGQDDEVPDEVPDEGSPEGADDDNGAGTGTSEDTAGGPDDVGGLDGTQPAIITALLESGYLAIDRPAEAPEAILEVEGYRYVLVTDEDLDPQHHEAPLRLVTDDEVSLPLVVVAPSPDADPEDQEDPQGGLVGLIREDSDLEDRVATVDGIDTFSGLIAMMLVLEDVHVSPPGHYGQADGAVSVVPTPR